MTKIAHTADVHIRALSRHDEYRHILKAFTEDCRSQNVDHIFVGGDIFHTKTTGISPEYIDLLTWWLNDMSSVATVHLVLGNHDGNLVNLSRQDAVSPIVEAMSNPKVKLYKKSGVYPMQPGYNLCVFSCFDEEGWSSVSPVPGEVNIASFHGPVRGSVTETGWDVEEGTTADFFKDYDFCLLGDIHKPQHLAFRDGKPWISYPGTPIQQNYAEQQEHGYLLWSIESPVKWDVETRPLPNIRPFVTVDWAGSLDETVEKAKKFPRGSRFRVRSQVQLTQDEVHRLSEVLKTEMSASEVTLKSDYQIDQKLVKAGTSTLVKTDLRSPDVMMKLLKDYHKDVVLSDSDMVTLTEKIKSYLSSVVTVEDAARNAKWSLRNLQWDNLFSYGEGNQVNFDKLNGIVGIFGPNRTGKSSIVGTLMYSLFNTTDRGPMKNINVCNVRKPYCSSKAVLDHNGTTYVVERQTTKSTNKKGVVSATTALNLFRMNEAGEMDDLVGEQRNDTEKTVRSLFGNAEDFLMTSLSAQGEINQFISQGSSKRRSILTRYLDLDVFDKLYEIASKETSGVKSQLKNFPDRNWEEIRSQYESSIEQHQKVIEDLIEKSAEEQSSLALLRQQLSNLSVVPVTQSDFDSQERRVVDLQQKSDECFSTIVMLESEVSELNKKLEAIQALIGAVDIESLKRKLDAQRKLEISITELRHAAEREQTLLQQQKKSLKILDEVPCGDDYPTCKFIKDAHTNKKNLASQEKKVTSSAKSLDDALTALNEIQDNTIQEKIEKHEKALSLSDKIRLEISRKETETEKLRASCETRKTSLHEAQKKLDNLREALNNQENDEVVSVRAKIEELTASIRKNDTDKMEAASQKGKLISNLEKLDQEKTVRDSLLQNIRIHELISNAFSKKGIPLVVTRSQLPVINTEVAKILHGIVDFSIELESDEDTDSLEIYINYGDSRRIIELCSGMEKTIASLALRVAMINVSSLPKPDFFIIDEGFGTLDNTNTEACSRFLVSLKRYFKTIVVITHVDGIKDAADHVLEITKVENDSKMEYV